MWIAPEPTPLADEPLTGPERPMLEAFLASQRHTLLNICAGLTESQLASRPLPFSDLSLLGLVRHLRKVERTWFIQRVAGLPRPPVFEGNDDFDNPSGQSFAEALEAYHRETQACDDAVRDLPLDTEFTLRGEQCSLRLVYLHLNTEYARHNGHADLLRETIDGTRGR